MCLPNKSSRSNHTTTCVHTSPWCARKVQECIIIVCARHRTLCTASTGLFFSCPPIYVCIILHMYIHAHPCSVSAPPPSTHKGSINTPIKKDSKKVNLVFYTRVSTHVIMACSKGTQAETTSQTRACVPTFAWRHACQELTSLFVESTITCSPPNMRVGGGGGGGRGQRARSWGGYVCDP